MSMVKEEAKTLIDKLPDQITWDDIMYEFYVKKKIEIGLKAAEEGHVVPHEEVKKRFLHAVLVDLKQWGEDWEDFYDILVSESRKGESTISWNELKAEKNNMR